VSIRPELRLPSEALAVFSQAKLFSISDFSFEEAVFDVMLTPEEWDIYRSRTITTEALL
jgi:hypothetical protein